MGILEVEELRRKIAVMQHFLGGGKVESIVKDTGYRSTVADPCWNWLLYNYLIKEESWRPATIDDAICAIHGKKIEARFRDNPSEKWFNGLLAGYRSTGNYNWLSSGTSYKVCEVLDV